MSLTKDIKMRKTPIINKAKLTHYPPSQNNLKQSASVSTKKAEKTQKFRIKNKVGSYHLSSYDSPDGKRTSKDKSRIEERTIKKQTKQSQDDSAIIHQYKYSSSKTKPNLILQSNSIVRKIN